MSKIAHVLAVDGGGSKTAAALLTAGGAELARCRVGPANLYRDQAAGLAEITAAPGDCSAVRRACRPIRPRRRR